MSVPNPSAFSLGPDAPDPNSEVSAVQLLQFARQGDPAAIAALINRHFSRQGLQVQASTRKEHLYLRVRADQIPAATSLLPPLQQGISRLSPLGLSQVTVLGESLSTGRIVWSETFPITTDDIFDGFPPALALPDAAISGIATLSTATLSTTEGFRSVEPEPDLHAPGNRDHLTLDFASEPEDLRQRQLEQTKLDLLQRYDQNQRDFKGIDLRQTDLQGQKLSLANFSHANLSWANLTQTNFSHTNLRQALMIEAQLAGADLRSANLEGANLQGADLKGANLSWAKLGGANLLDADLRGANLTDTDLVRATLPDGTVLD